MKIRYTTAEGGLWHNIEILHNNEEKAVKELTGNLFETDNFVSGSPKRSQIEGIEIHSVELPSGKVFDATFGGLR